MAETKGIDELRDLNRKLASLLDDPQPGIATWRMCLNKLLMQMADYAGMGRVSAFGDLRNACKWARAAINGSYGHVMAQATADTCIRRLRNALAKAGEGE